MAKIHKTTTAATASIAPFGLRMLPDLRQKIEDAAKASGRSMNAEVVSRLEQTFSATSVTPDSSALHALAIRLAETELALAEEKLQRESLVIDAYTVASTLQKYYGSLLASNDLKVPVDIDELSDCMDLLDQFEMDMEDLNDSSLEDSYEELKAAKKRLAALKPKPKKVPAKRTRGPT